MLKTKKYLLYVVTSFIFLLQTSAFMASGGDQEWFKKAAHQYSFFGFAIERYKTWSSRLLIESVTMLMSDNYTLFYITVFLVVIGLFLSLDKAFYVEGRSRYISFLFPPLFLLFFPSQLFTSAGIVATVTNYLFPMAAMVVGLVLYWFYDSVVLEVLSIIFIVFSVMQEQFALILLLYYTFMIPFKFVNDREYKNKEFILWLIGLLGVINALVCPGSKNRYASEVKSWFPNFNKISIPNKLYLGFTDTNKQLFLEKHLSFILLFIILLLAVSIYRRQFLNMIALFSLVFLMIYNYFDLDNLLQVVDKNLKSQSGPKHIIPLMFSKQFTATLLPTTVFVILLTIILVGMWSILKGSSLRLSVLVLAVVGYGSRMMMSLSPTLYASDTRTFIPFIFTIFISVIVIFQKIDELLMEKRGENNV